MKEASILQSKPLDGETKRLLLNWYVGKFPIPRRGLRVPREAARELELLMKKNEAWTPSEEAEINRIVESLLDCPLHNR